MNTLDELEAIRERHQEAEHDNNSNWATDHGPQAHFDRETLLRLLDAALEEIATWHSVFPDIAPDRVLPDRSRMEGAMLVLAEELDAAQAELAEIREAAGPFLVWADLDDGRPDDQPVESLLPAGAYRRLAAALAKDATT